MFLTQLTVRRTSFQCNGSNEILVNTSVSHKDNSFGLKNFESPEDKKVGNWVPSFSFFKSNIKPLTSGLNCLNMVQNL